MPEQLELGTSDPSIRRRLTEIEYVNWCFGQPYNIAVVVHLSGRVTVPGVREAIAGLQRRHPLLRVTTVIDRDGMPWLESADVDRVPVRVIEQAAPGDAARLLDTDVATPFVMDHAPVPTGTTTTGTPRPPLFRVTVLAPRPPAGGMDVVLCAQHVIADGLSLFFLVRDLVHLLRDPDASPVIADQAARCEHVLPPEAARRMHRTPAVALTVRALLDVHRRLRPLLSRRPAPDPVRPGEPALAGTVPVHSWQLTPEQTTALLDRCRAERVSVQSAVCTAFLPSYGAVNTPVSLRGRLGVDVGDAVGLYVGNAVVMRSYRPGHDFWWNARAFHRRLRRAMRDPFFMIRFCSPAVPRAVVHDVMTGLMALVGRRRPLAVTNLGALDGNGLTLDTGDGPRVESFHGGMSGFASASVLTVYTIDAAMRFHLRGSPDMTPDRTIREAEQATSVLLAAIDVPSAG